MKSKYVVYTNYGVPELSKAVKSFKNLPEAMSFISSDKNMSQYGEMTLKRVDASGANLIWNDRKRLWDECENDDLPLISQEGYATTAEEAARRISVR